MWTLVVFVVVGGESIVIDGFSQPKDCTAMGQLNVEHVQWKDDKPNPAAKFRCDKTGRPATICLPDRRSYGRTADCIVKE